MADWEQCSAVERNPNKLSGAWVFRGTRVPVSALFENLKDGATVEQFLEWFPGVEVKESEGKITVSAGHEMGFIEVLDRRRYELELVKGQPERFRASGRTPVKG